MNKLLTTTAIATVLSFGSSAAFAVDTDINQFVFNVQAALNTAILTNDGTNISQSATNASNIVSLGKFAAVGDADPVNAQIDLDTINQLAIGDQNAFNLVAVDSKFGKLKDVEQKATNVANSVSAQDLTGPITQSTSGWGIDNDLDQSAFNTIILQNGLVATDVDTPTLQAATNAANLVNVGDVDTSLFQDFAYGSSQQAINTIVEGFDYGFFGFNNQALENITQEATNVANIVTASGDNEAGNGTGTLKGENWGWIVQVGSGDQLAVNTVDFISNDAKIKKLTQEALNVLNSVSADLALTTISQIAGYGASQNAFNYVEFGDGDDYEYYSTPALQDVTQEATNAANLVSVNLLEADVYQTATLDQYSANTALFIGDESAWGYNNGSVKDLTQDATNIANIISVDSFGGNFVDLNQSMVGDQFATNTLIADGWGNNGVNSISDVTQTATNVANSIGLMN